MGARLKGRTHTRLGRAHADRNGYRGRTMALSAGSAVNIPEESQV